MNIFEQYGIKEVADVCLYAIELDENDDEVYVPVLYLDTLKISSVEETAEQTSARGGLGNPELIIWDYGKEITVTLEDALYTPASQGMTWGGKLNTKHFCLYGDLITKIPIGENTTTDKIEKAKFEITKMNDAKKTQGQNESVQAFRWTVDGYIITDYGDRFFVKDEYLFYDYINNRWFINSLGSSVDDGNGSFIIDSKRSFKLIMEYNKNILIPQEVIYQIDHTSNNVHYLDRIEKCKASQTFAIDTRSNTLHGSYRYLEKYSQCELSVFIDPKTMQPYEPNASSYTRKNGEVLEGDYRIIKQNEIYYKWTRSKAAEELTLGHQIIVDSSHFPGTYRLVGETFSRSRSTGKDQRFQFEIPLCKMGTENSFTLEAEGEPTTFNMTLKVLRREDGVMMKLTQYNTESAQYDNYYSDSTKVVPQAKIVE